MYVMFTKELNVSLNADNRWYIGNIMLFLTLKQQVPEIEEIQYLKLHAIQL